MKLDEYINILNDLKEQVGGEIRVVENNPYAALYAIRDAHEPIIETLQVKTKRETYEKIFRKSYVNKKEDSGIKVICI